MECACSVSCEVDDYATLLRDKMVTARKPHQCHECRRVIPIGEEYRHEATTYEGRASTHKTCLDCNSIREVLCRDGFYWGGIRELVRDHIYECRGAIPESCIAQLTPGARGWVCGIIDDINGDEGVWDDES